MKHAHCQSPEVIPLMHIRQPIAEGSIELLLGNIVDQQVDAIVNAANASLLGGGGVDGAIHDAAGPDLLEACCQLPSDSEGLRCPTGEARSTAAFDLPARWVIHAVGPVYNPDSHEESCRLLLATYRSSLDQAHDLGCESIAFPAISTGAYQFPLREAASIAVSSARTYLEACSTPTLIRFVLFGQPEWDVFRQAID